ncbi:hypothetical protein COEREDRAFT_9390 [Coemansia reversa NRRL 1564]|uniref:Protein kinase domain-containing protein n=1 Tax=Coemansia reversa (strain ATCC 12441 / NRRL 1564) TaxID=763665 RepID=A0A2G5B8W4_COERN|nr:hypothetical protein COEREDRAFT_9390 [Coemansia reversa NRRL 1564]|eukprot:PIA15458.1 hypothetical protein COEREDRAFT_9390 [Coemansia reversa NRRL 1564]
MLHISADFKKFSDRFRGVFTAIALRAPSYMNRKLTQSNIDIEDTCSILKIDESISGVQLRCLDSFKGLESLGQSNEEALVAYFIEIMTMVRRAQTTFLPEELKLWPVSAYSVLDHQNTPVSGGRHKIDCAFHYENHSECSLSSVHIPVEAKSSARGDVILDKDFGQMADYARAIWKCQPTRTFVPVIFLHGHRMRLLVFTRGKCFQVDLGNYCYHTLKPSLYDIVKVRMSLQKLVFLSILSSQKFGHFCDIGNCEPTYVKFSHAPEFTGSSQSSALACAAVVSEEVDGAIKFDEFNRIERPVNPRSRLVHIYRVLYQGKAAILKLSWIPTNRLPESAVYDTLQRSGVENTPEVFDIGILITDVFGYRVEYLIIRSCGISLVDYLKSQKISQSGQYDTIEQLTRQIISCLLQAWRVGILHRDISSGNVVVHNGRATVIDWGYAKLIDCDACDIDSLAAKWMFDKNEVMSNEDAHNSITGTPLVGILHRDISSGNVVVHNGRATVIDWGYAKLIDCDACDIDSLAAKWMFDKNEVMSNEDAHNSITGTPLFMSIPILVRSTKRSIVDDVESAFYVILDALAASQNVALRSNPVAMDFKDNRNLAFVRGCCLSASNMYLHTFGVRECNDKLRELLDALYCYLFVRDGNYIGGYLAIIPDYNRSVEEQELCNILNDTTHSNDRRIGGSSHITRDERSLRRSARLKQTREGSNYVANTSSGTSDMHISAMPQPPSKRKRNR